MDDLVEPVALAPGVGAWFTGRAAGNLAHRRPHLPSRLGRARQGVADAIALETEALHYMKQIHGAEVGRVDAETVQGAEIREVDALVTSEPGRALVVQVADCVPVLLAAEFGPVGAVHVGRRGLVAGVLTRAVHAMTKAGAASGDVRAAIGPAIGGCCYEVPAEMREQVSTDHPMAGAETTWGTPSLDLRAAVRSLLDGHGVMTSAETPGCTHCDPEGRWYSHRRDPSAGRQVGIVVIEHAA
jgi:polyphenol oxidase